MSLYLSGDAQADELLSADAYALIVGMVLDQQVPLERAFSAPHALRERLKGKLDPKTVARMDSAKLIEAFVERPALHRFPAAMAERVQAVSQIIIDQYHGKAEEIWTSATSGAELLKNLRALPGFGEQKAKIFIALLGKQLGVRPEGWEQASAPFSTPGTHASIADIDSYEARLMVREYKKDMKAAAKAATVAPRPSASKARAKATAPAPKATAPKATAPKATKATAVKSTKK